VLAIESRSSPSPFDARYDEWVLEQFPRGDRRSVRAQLDASYEPLVLVSGTPARIRASIGSACTFSSAPRSSAASCLTNHS